jgi:hypothetical protein
MELRMSLSRTALVGFSAIAMTAAACGGSTPAPATTAPSAKAPASAAPAASSAAPAQQPAAQQFDVDMVPTRVSPPPKTMPHVSVDVPGPDQFVPATFLAKKDYKVRPNVRGMEAVGEGTYLQLIIDTVPAAPIKDLKAPIKLVDLVPGGELKDGEHVIAGFLCRANHESVKGPDGIGVNRFWTVKNSGKEYKSNAPMVVLSRPFGTYTGAAADDILVDWYLLNAVLGPKDLTVRITLKGPGIKEEGLVRNITDWTPYSIVSPHSGEYTITAELLDKDYNPVPGIWNNTSRKFKVEK